MQPMGAGDRWFRAQVAEHGRVLYVIAWRILRDTAAAEDACQQTFLKAWQWRERLERDGGEDGQIGPWLRKVVVNESLALLRRRRTEAAGRGTVAALAKSTPDPAEQFAEHEFVAAALAALPEPTRTIVRLRVVDGISGNDVARAMGCSASEVSRRLHAGMEQLRRVLVRQEQEQGDG